MELRHLRYFVALARELSFTRAARQTHVTQSTLSHQIRRLEEELQQRLFERVGKRVRLTQAGQILLPGVLRSLAELDDGLRAISAPAEALSGQVRIGASQTFTLNLLPACLATYLTDHPGVRITVEELSADAIEARLAAEAIDLGVAYRPRDLERVSFEPLFQDRLMLVVGSEHRFARRKLVRMAELHNQPLALFTPEFATRRLIDDCFRGTGATPRVMAEMTTIGPILGLVRCHPIAAILSAQALPGSAGLRAIPLDHPALVRTWGALLRRDRPMSAAAHALLGLIRAECRSLGTGTAALAG
ncbi:LysR substrate-binding domain-containing protein [Methylobacterium isbiliense]|jgi:LysR family cyn operon transcriptional activator|uniref:HTH-type transcriptional regulator CynR n=1 Tax=Methylobacterium isbiliense TaxID=315478 RepID=A0ABQ4SPX0_9HYPH|nr:LysR substrate-binding domain-containing protein [Methylobacterium isbiliense]MDN3626606.1 LysR substrate-binding domain-containing protein [Methylobacterium isbiliense]GJE03905.1 HTH-type transcriptional regulator CynR [Methylobacterium isbiliense]